MNNDSDFKKEVKDIWECSIENAKTFLTGCKIIFAFIFAFIVMSGYALLWYFIFTGNIIAILVLIVIMIFLYLLLSGVYTKYQDNSGDGSVTHIFIRAATWFSFIAAPQVALIFKFLPLTEKFNDNAASGILTVTSALTIIFIVVIGLIVKDN